MGEFNAVSAKMSKMTSLFLTDKDYINMSRFQTVSEIVNYIKENTNLSTYLRSRKKARLIQTRSFDEAKALLQGKLFELCKCSYI